MYQLGLKSVIFQILDSRMFRLISSRASLKNLRQMVFLSKVTGCKRFFHINYSNCCWQDLSLLKSVTFKNVWTTNKFCTFGGGFQNSFFIVCSWCFLRGKGHVPFLNPGQGRRSQKKNRLANSGLRNWRRATSAPTIAGRSGSSIIKEHSGDEAVPSQQLVESISPSA